MLYNLFRYFIYKYMVMFGTIIAVALGAKFVQKFIQATEQDNIAYTVGAALRFILFYLYCNEVYNGVCYRL